MSAGSVLPHGVLGSGGTRRFVRHLAEMVIAMMLGMLVLGAAFRGLHVALLGSHFSSSRHPELAVLAMTVEMTVPMVVWMRHRAHGWRVSGEMAAAMVAAGVLAVGLHAIGMVSASAVLAVEMVAMYAAMVVAMLLRPDEYTH